MKLHKSIMGEGKTIVILHGLFGSSDNWLTFGRMLESEGYKVIFVDLRNHGKSGHSTSHSYQDMADDLNQFFTDENLNEIILIGHSMGGKAAIKFAFNHPEFISKLIVLDIAPRYYPLHHQNIIIALNSVNFNEVKSRSNVDEIVSTLIPEQAVRQFLLKNLYWKAEGVLDWRFNLKTITNEIENVGEAVFSNIPFKQPTLFLKGEKSDYITYDDEREIFELFSNVEVQSVPDSGHWLHVENPNDLLKKIIKFVEK